METIHQAGKDCDPERWERAPVHNASPLRVSQRADSGYYWLAQQLRSVSLGVTAHQATSGDDKGE